MARVIFVETQRADHHQRLARSLRSRGHRVHRSLAAPGWWLRRHLDGALLLGWGEELSQQPTPDVHSSWVSVAKAVEETFYPFAGDAYWWPPLDIFQQQQLLEAAGVRVLNRPTSVKAAMFKSHTAARLQAAQLPGLALKPWREESFADGPLVLKPDVGWGGWGVQLVDNLSQARALVANSVASWVLQEYCRPAICWRCIATPDDALTCYQKITASEQLVAAVSTGARREYRRHNGVAALAQATVAAFAGDVLGIDMLENDQGMLAVIDVNVSFGFDTTNTALITALSEQISACLEQPSPTSALAVQSSTLLNAELR
jgi:hypothetical protein